MASHLRDSGPQADSLGKGSPTSIALMDGPGAGGWGGDTEVTEWV